MSVDNEVYEVDSRRLGRLPVKANRKALQFADFMEFLKLPKVTRHWTNRKGFEHRTFGNDEWGDCTRAKQAAAALRMERLEQKKTVAITDEEVVRVYQEMSTRLYGGGDGGAFEDDALSEWRRPDRTFRDVAGNPYTIDAFLRINPFNHDELRAGLALSGARGIAVCVNLPAAWRDVSPPADWSIPRGQILTGAWMAGSWGGHSMWARDYDATGIWLVHTWGMPDQRITWEAAAVYLDEAHLVVDSVDAWRKKPSALVDFDLNDVVAAVNEVSSFPIAPSAGG